MAIVDFAPTTLSSGRCSAGVGDEVNILVGRRRTGLWRLIAINVNIVEVPLIVTADCGRRC